MVLEIPRPAELSASHWASVSIDPLRAYRIQTVLRDVGCKAYIYRTDTDDCWLKFAAGTPTPCDVCFGRNDLEEVNPMLCHVRPSHQ